MTDEENNEVYDEMYDVYDDYDNEYDYDEYDYEDYYEAEYYEPPTRWQRFQSWWRSLYWSIRNRFTKEMDDIPF